VARILVQVIVFSLLVIPTQGAAQSTKKCIGLKQYYAGKCRYPAEIKKLKAKKIKKRGALGGRCYQNKTCNEGLVCKDKRCAKPSTGTLGGACYGNKTCNNGLRCSKAKLCVTVPAGSLGGACYGNGTCDQGLSCANKTCAQAPKKERSKTRTTRIRGAKITRGTERRKRVTKARELPGLRKLGLVMVDPHPGWELKVSRENTVQLVNKKIGVFFSVLRLVRSGNFSLWKGKIRDELRRGGADIRSSRLMRLDGVTGVLMTGSSPASTEGAGRSGYNEQLIKVGDYLVRLIWVSSMKKGKVDSAFLAALKTATLVPPLRSRR